MNQAMIVELVANTEDVLEIECFFDVVKISLIPLKSPFTALVLKFFEEDCAKVIVGHAGL